VALCRIEIPSSVEKIKNSGFSRCTSLNEIVFSSESHLNRIEGFQGCTSLCRIEIPSSVEKIKNSGFPRCTSLNEIVFSSESHLKDIDGFGGCTSLCRIEIPSSVESIGDNGFSGCTSLNEIVFSSDSHLLEIHGCSECTSLCRMEIPSSVEVITDESFRDFPSLRVIIIPAGCRPRRIRGLQIGPPFVVYGGEDMKHRRRQIHLGLGGREYLTCRLCCYVFKEMANLNLGIVTRCYVKSKSWIISSMDKAGNSRIEIVAN
jgi:hypothetical protein